LATLTTVVPGDLKTPKVIFNHVKFSADTLNGLRVQKETETSIHFYMYIV